MAREIQNVLVPTRVAERVLGVTRQRFNDISNDLFALVLHGTLRRFPASYLLGLRDQLTERSQRPLIDAAQKFALGETALRNMDEWPDRYNKLVANMAVEYGDGLVITAQSLARVTHLGVNRLYTWRHDPENPVQSVRIGSGRHAEVAIPLQEVQRISSWQYPEVLGNLPGGSDNN